MLLGWSFFTAIYSPINRFTAVDSLWVQQSAPNPAYEALLSILIKPPVPRSSLGEIVRDWEVLSHPLVIVGEKAVVQTIVTAV